MKNENKRLLKKINIQRVKNNNTLAYIRGEKIYKPKKIKVINNGR